MSGHATEVTKITSHFLQCSGFQPVHTCTLDVSVHSAQTYLHKLAV